MCVHVRSSPSVLKLLDVNADKLKDILPHVYVPRFSSTLQRIINIVVSYSIISSLAWRITEEKLNSKSLNPKISVHRLRNRHCEHSRLLCSRYTQEKCNAIATYNTELKIAYLKEILSIKSPFCEKLERELPDDKLLPHRL